MSFYFFYNIRFSNKRIDREYNRLLVRLLNIILPPYYYISSFFFKRKLENVDDLNNKNSYIVSLTSFPVRIDKLWLVIESLLRQHDKPDAIMVWLYKGEFDGKSSLPPSLLKLEKKIQINFCDENLMPHKKYFYTMKKYPKANIITVDDDVFYPPTLIGDLKKCHKKNPNSICSTTTRVIKINKSTLQPYAYWHIPDGPLKKSYKLQQIGVGGVLYPPNSLHKEVFNINVLKQKALKADDMWLKVMSLKNETKILGLPHARKRRFLPIIIKGNKQLMKSNVEDGQNDKILRDIMNHYELSNSVFERKDIFNSDRALFTGKKNVDLESYMIPSEGSRD